MASALVSRLLANAAFGLRSMRASASMRKLLFFASAVDPLPLCPFQPQSPPAVSAPLSTRPGRVCPCFVLRSREQMGCRTRWLVTRRARSRTSLGWGGLMQ
eukprot:5964819-Pleurochrysis_carterae.AAC.1